MKKQTFFNAFQTLILFLILLSLNCFAKTDDVNNKIKFADTKKEGVIHGYEKILSHPYFISSDPELVVIEFTITFFPKAQDLIGPYKTTGSKLTEQQIEILNKLKDSKIEKVRVLITDVHAYYKGKDVIISPFSTVIVP